MIERLRQTYRHLRVAPDGVLAATLPPLARRVVDEMSTSDRRHALVTFAALRDMGADEELRLAGALHDMGKPREARLWHRVAAVLSPSLSRRLGPAVLRAYVDHAGRGAAMARELDLSPRVVRVIERHHLTPSDEDERRLHEAERVDA